MEYLSPDIDSLIPLPVSATDAMPNLSPREELEMRARTVKMLSDLTGQPITPTEPEKDAAREAAHAMMTNPENVPALAQYSNPTLAYLAGMVAQHDTYIVQELAEIGRAHV